MYSEITADRYEHYDNLMNDYLLYDEYARYVKYNCFYNRAAEEGLDMSMPNFRGWYEELRGVEEEF